MNNKIKISAVSYTNTKPFLYGLQHSDIIDKIDLSIDVPADCAQKLIDGRVDIGLIPVAAILSLSQWEIVSEFCIGASGPVNSVFIFSNCDIKDIKILQLDPQSRSSNNLARVLLRNYWKTDHLMISDATDYGTSNDPNTAFVQIGDRTFGQKEKFKYVYDLAEEWKNFTGLPFVFAAWVANKPIPADFITAFNKAMQYGLDHRQEVINALPEHKDFDVQDYLMHKLDFELTEDKKTALHLFHHYIRKLDQ
ncbi:MAG TPA: menaquinone biosynthesis protein [Mucilaginibacter sp.]|nr:menaquinone biosynthesis protein [Mucilaginibacter sp.]